MKYNIFILLTREKYIGERKKKKNKIKNIHNLMNALESKNLKISDYSLRYEVDYR